MAERLVESPLPRVGQNCCAIARADRFGVVVDGEEYFATFVRAAESAQRSLLIVGWDFDSRTPLLFDEQGQVKLMLGEFLNRLARRRRRLQIRILNWDYPMVFGKDRELASLGLNWTPHRRVYYRYDNTHPPGGSHHQKIVVIDDRLAFVGGLDLTTKRWDSSEHLANDPRRMAGGKPYSPFHDMMAVVDGEAARTLADIAKGRWEKATGERIRPVKLKADVDPWPEGLEPMITGVDVGVSCTVPAVEGEAGVRDVERLYIDMIASARRYLYIENQYFTSARVGDALAARLAEDDPPEIVLVTRLLSHGWLEEMTMHVLRTKLVRRLRALDHRGRFHVYYPDVEGLAEDDCIDMHSKLMIVDDRLLRIGSSNLSNRSMGFDTECDVVVDANGDPRVEAAIRGFRDRLLAEQLDARVEDVAQAIAREGSLSRVIDAGGTTRRRLRRLDHVPEWSDALVSTVALADPERPVSFDELVDEFAPVGSDAPTVPFWKTVLVTATVTLALAALWIFTPLAGIVTADNVAAWAEDVAHNPWAPLVIMLAYTPACFVMFPRPLITLAAAVAFGPWVGFGYAMAGILFAGFATYLIGRRMPEYAVRRYAGERFARISGVMRKHGVIAVTVLRLVPLAPFAVEGIVAGALRMRLSHLLIGTFLGMLPGVMTATVFGGQVHTALRDPTAINYGLLVGAVLLLLVATLAARRWFLNLERAARAAHRQATDDAGGLAVQHR